MQVQCAWINSSMAYKFYKMYTVRKYAFYSFILFASEVNRKDCNCAIKQIITVVQVYHPAISITTKRKSPPTIDQVNSDQIKLDNIIKCPLVLYINSKYILYCIPANLYSGIRTSRVPIFNSDISCTHINKSKHCSGDHTNILQHGLYGCIVQTSKYSRGY